MKDTLLTIPETAEVLRVSRATVYRLIAKRGGIPVVRLTKNGPLRVRRTDLDRYLERRAKARA